MNGRSLSSVPGFVLLSLVLFGLKQRTQGNLAAPIGLRSGIMTASYLTQISGVIAFKPETPFWMVSTYHLHPFDGAIGLSICALLAIIFFPQRPVQKDTSVSWESGPTKILLRSVSTRCHNVCTKREHGRAAPVYTMLKVQLTLLMHCNLLGKEHPASCFIAPRVLLMDWSCGVQALFCTRLMSSVIVVVKT